jgi:hypothetical protein
MLLAAHGVHEATEPAESSDVEARLRDLFVDLDLARLVLQPVQHAPPDRRGQGGELALAPRQGSQIAGSMGARSFFSVFGAGAVPFVGAVFSVGTGTPGNTSLRFSVFSFSM